MPSLADEWGMVVNEAMASGLPVLGCIGTQAVEELVKHDCSCWVYAPGAEVGLRQALREVLATESTAILEMGHAARHAAVECSDDVTAERILEALRKVMNPL